MKKNDVIAMLERLKTEEVFSGFEIKASENSLVRRFDWGWQKLVLEYKHSWDLERKDLAVVIEPVYEVRFNAYHKWFEKYSPYDLRDQRARYTVAFTETMLDKPRTFLGFRFLENGEGYEADFEAMKNDVLRHASQVFGRFQTLKDLYDYRMEVLWSEDTKRLRHSGDWIFEDMFLTKVVSPENYPVVKQAILERLQAIYDNVYTRSSHTEYFYAKADEIIAYLETLTLDNIPKRVKTGKAKAEKPKTKPTMKLSEKEKIIKDVKRAIGKKYGYKQHDYINWKIKDGYFFCLDTLHVVCTRLEVKPVYMDDLYWKIIYPHKDTKLPDSLRGNGTLSYLGKKIWEKRFPEELDMNFTTELCEQIWEDVYRKAEEEVESFLKKYPHPSDFPRFIEGNEKTPVLTQMLIKIYEGKYEEVYRMAKGYIDQGKIGSQVWVMEDGTDKGEYEFILDYCLAAGAK